MSAQFHTNKDTGLKELASTATHARGATHFRKIRAARADLEQAKAELLSRLERFSVTLAAQLNRS